MSPNNLFHWQDSTWLLLDQWGILLGLILSLLNIAMLIFAIVKRESLRRWFMKNHFPHVGGDDTDLDWQALLFTVSHIDVPKWMIDKIQPKLVALVASQASYDNAKKIQQYAIQKGIEVLPIREVDDIDNPAETMDEVKLLLKRIKEKELKRCAVDITGGKVPMSMGAFMAAEEMQLDTLYVTTKFDAKLKKPDMTTAKIITISSNH